MVSARGAACRTCQDLRFLDADESLPVSGKLIVYYIIFTRFRYGYGEFCSFAVFACFMDGPWFNPEEEWVLKDFVGKLCKSVAQVLRLEKAVFLTKKF